MPKKHKDTPPEGEERKRFTVYVDCENEVFQGKNFGPMMVQVLARIIGKISAAELSGPITFKHQTIGNWKTHWRNDDPADRRPKRGKSKEKPT
jgi:hypothetical protein